MGQIGKGLEYLKSIPFILKIIEFVVLVIAIGTVGYYLDNSASSNYDKKGNLQFFMFVTVVAWLIVIALVVVFVAGIHDKLTVINWPLTVAIIMAVWAVLLLISSALVADTVAYYMSLKSPSITTYHYCKLLDVLNTKPQCGQLIAGAVFGFVAMALFALDTFLHFRVYTTGGDAPSAPSVNT